MYATHHTNVVKKKFYLGDFNSSATSLKKILSPRSYQKLPLVFQHVQFES